MTNREFSDRFYAITQMPDYNKQVSALKSLLKEAKSSLQKQIIISSNDVYDLSRRTLEGIIHDAVYNCVDSTFLIVNYKDYGYNYAEYYCYKGSWISTTYLYEILKGYVSPTLSKYTSYSETYRNICYILKNCDVTEICLLE